MRGNGTRAIQRTRRAQGVLGRRFDERDAAT